MGKVFDDGISDYMHIKLELDITFPKDKKGNIYACCEWCRLYTGRRCVVTGHAPINATKMVAYGCPLMKEENQCNSEN